MFPLFWNVKRKVLSSSQRLQTGWFSCNVKKIKLKLPILLVSFPSQLWLTYVYVVVQFYPWFNLNFPLLFFRLIYDIEYETKENKN